MAHGRIAALEAFSGWSWEPREKERLETLGALSEWMAAAKRIPTQKSSDSKEVWLAKWIHHRRRDLATKQMALERIAALEAIPGWSWEPREVGWAKTLEVLQKWMSFVKRTPTRGSSDATEARLATWLHHQRDDVTAKQMARERISALEAIPGWLWEPRGMEWATALESLKKWTSSTGRIPRLQRRSGSWLVHWINARRKTCASGNMTQGRIVALDVLLVWPWDAHENAWKDSFKELQAWVDAASGKFPSRRACGAGSKEEQLASWTARQRGSLQAGRIDRLNSWANWRWAPRDYRDMVKAQGRVGQREGHSPQI